VGLLVLAVFGTAARSEETNVPRVTVVKLLLLRQKSVQKELGLDEDTVKKINAHCDKEHEAAKKALQMKGDERKKAFEKMAKENEKFLADTLNEKQGKRLDQIRMQFTALRQLLKPETIKELKLTDDQVKKLKEIHNDCRKEVVDLLKAKEREGKGKKLAKIREEARKKVLDVLTDDQKKLIREKVGEQFKGEIEFEADED
jgi:hypothetical protein